MTDKKQDTIPHENWGWFKKQCAVFREMVNTLALESDIRRILGKQAEQYITTFRIIHKEVKCDHNPSYVLNFLVEILKQEPNSKRFPDACFVEAGCFKGGSSAKFSHFVSMLGRDLYLFDSFEGLPDNTEDHKESVEGYSIKNWFDGGQFLGTLDEVKSNITQFGKIDCCRFEKGWFENTMPNFNKPILAAFIDVDLASSTLTCMKYLYPLLVPGGVIVSEDGDFPLVIDVFKKSSDWLPANSAEVNLDSLGKQGEGWYSHYRGAWQKNHQDSQVA
ncbi:hypothetical protein FACS189419_02550 [Planctomycetales bacterium]|nr:hypothetical protein FACS189419_02550 [Planctomycetales bacterium]